MNNTLKRSFEEVGFDSYVQLKPSNASPFQLTNQANNVLEGSMYLSEGQSKMENLALKPVQKKRKMTHVVEEKKQKTGVDEYLQALLDQPRFNHPAVLEHKDLEDLVKTLEQQKITLQKQLEASIQELKASPKGWHSFGKVETGVAVFQSPLIDGQGKLIAINETFISAIGLDRSVLEGSFNSETIQAFLMASNRSFITQEPGDGTVCITLE